ncbi:MAG: SdrD B-like domain-containing protein, partial [Emticicia sp.]|uniref:SdrD B-like domain-containing protein n=1 Tax=Emticicia sp. TaxID=1930953 RepID=UPI003BA667BF
VTVTSANGCTATATTVVTLAQCGSIGDYVWNDTNNNGQQDSAETPIQGVKIYLLDGLTGAKLDSTFTDAAGKYLFDSLLNGSYQVKFVAPISTIAAKQNTGADLTDSDANKEGLSQLINIDTTKLPSDTLRNNTQIDAGFVSIGSIGDYVFADNNGDGIQNTGDLPIANVKVYLLDGNTGAKLDSVLTTANGAYKFDSLLVGTYRVQIVLPPGYTSFTLPNTGDDTKDSDVGTTGLSQLIVIDISKLPSDTLRNNPKIDAGLIPSSTRVDLALKKTVLGDCKRKIGDSITFNIVVKREDNADIIVNAAVKDSLSTNFTFISATPSIGSYSNVSGMWTGINLAKGDSAVLTIVAKINQGSYGLVCNDAWINFMDVLDFDSQAGNKIETEDDFARACVSVPMPLCTARNERVILSAPVGYSAYQWYKNGQIIVGANDSFYTTNSIGEYTVTVDSGSCPANVCCPIYIEDFCDCPPTICVPFMINKTKTRSK